MVESVAQGMTRRTLLSAAALAAAQKPIRAAVYGIGHAHAMGKINALRKLPEFELAGVCEPDATRPRTHAVLEGVRWLSEREMLEDASIELIAVESRVQENLAYARRAIDAGKFVHLDKAPGNNLPAFRDLLDAAARGRRVVQQGYMWRYHPAIQAALEAARSGWLGDVYSFRARIDKPIPTEERRQLAAFRGGMMFELGCHLIDRATSLLGRPDKVTGHLWTHASGAADGLADNTLAILEYPRAIAEISVAAMHPHGNSYRTIEVSGSNGSATVRPFSPNRLMTHLRDPAGPYPAGLKETTFPPERLAYAADFLEMARIIRDGAAPSYTAAHDRMTQEVLLRACHEI